MTYTHRTNDPCTDFSYDNLDRLTIAEYGIEDNNEVFTINDLGNRTNVNVRDSNDVTYSVDNLTNRYTTVGGSVVERYEYDAYGNCYILDADFTDDADGLSDYDNSYLFTGRRIDILDNGSLKIQYSRHRYYDYYIGRFLQHDPLGINPAGGKENPFSAIEQYTDGLNLFQYARSNLVIYTIFSQFFFESGFLS